MKRIITLVRCAPVACAVIVLSVGPLTKSYADETVTNEVFAKYARYGADVWANNASATISGEGQGLHQLPYVVAVRTG